MGGLAKVLVLNNVRPQTASSVKKKYTIKDMIISDSSNSKAI